MNARTTYTSQQVLTNWRLGAELQDDGGLHLIRHHGGSIDRLELSPAQTVLLRNALNGWGGCDLSEGEG